MGHGRTILGRHEDGPVASASEPGRLSAGLRRTFQSLDIPTYRILWWGTLFSFVGMQMQVVARGYLAFDLTGRNTALGGVMIAFGVPQLLFAFYGGAVADRMAKRNVLMFWQSMIALGSGLMTLAIATGHVEYWMLLASGVVTGLSFAFIGPARQAFIGDLVPGHMMGNAIVLQQANMNGTRVVGPALAGALIAVPLIGMAGVYALTTIGFVIATVTMLRLPPGLPKRQHSGRSTTQDTLEGLRYVGSNTPMAVLLLQSFFVVSLAFPYQGFLASITRDEFNQGAIGLGLLSSMSAVGALAATLAVATLTGHRRVWWIQALSGVGFGLSLIGFGLAPNFVSGMIVVLFVGAGASAFQSLNNALTMTLSDPRYYGRIQALMGLSWSLFGIISLPLGILADAIGIRTTLVLMGLSAIVAIFVLQTVARFLGAEAEMRRRRADIFERNRLERITPPAPATPPAAAPAAPLDASPSVAVERSRG